MIKKVYLTTFLILLPITLLCGTPQTIPQLPETHRLQSWTFEGGPLYLSSTNRAYNGHIFNPKFAWGYGLKGQYHFSKAKSILLEGLQYQNNQNVSEFSNDVIFGEGGTHFNAGFSETLNIINLTLTKTFNYFDRIDISYFGGFQYLHFHRRLSLDLQSNTTASELNSLSNHSLSSVGPRLGLNLDYELYHQIHFFVNGAYASLVLRDGSKSVDETSIDRRYPQTKNDSYNVTIKEQGPLGGQDAKLGLSYQSDQFQGHIKISTGIVGLSFDIEDTRFYGFYLSLTWEGNA